MIEVPAAAIALAKQFEGFHRVPKFDPERRAHPYICPAGYWTIGFGHLCVCKCRLRKLAEDAAETTLMLVEFQKML